jgi:hypothetical protein
MAKSVSSRENTLDLMMTPLLAIPNLHDRIAFINELCEQTANVCAGEYEYRRICSLSGAGQRPYGFSKDGNLDGLHRLMVLRAAGYGFRDIAHVLNEEGVPTKRDGTRWQSFSVNRIVRWYSDRNIQLKDMVTSYRRYPALEGYYDGHDGQLSWRAFQIKESVWSGELYELRREIPPKLPTRIVHTPEEMEAWRKAIHFVPGRVL